MKWAGTEHCQSEDILFATQDIKNKEGRVAVRKDTTETVLELSVINYPIMLIRLCRQCFNIMVIQMYAPTTDVQEKEAGGFYSQVQFEIDRTWKQNMLYII